MVLKALNTHTHEERTMLQAIAKRLETLCILAHISPSQPQHLSAPLPPLSMLYGFRDVNQSNKEQH